VLKAIIFFSKLYCFVAQIMLLYLI